MEDNRKRQLADLDDYHYDTKEIALRAIENLRNIKEYCKLEEQYLEARRQHNLLQISQLSARINKMKQDEVHRLVLMEEERRKNIERISDVLRSIDPAEEERYQMLLAALSLLLDMVDTVFSEINIVLRKNKIGVEMDNFPELKAAMKIVWEMAFDEQDKMMEYKNKLWSEESQRLYKYILERSAVYCRKVDRIEARMEKSEVK